ncbi:MAG: caspase family protein [Salibacteraceae bacterium]
MIRPNSFLLFFGLLLLSAAPLLGQLPQHAFSGPGSGNLMALSFDQSGERLLTGRSGNFIGIRNLAADSWDAQLKPGQGSLTAIAFHPNQPLFIAAREDFRVLFWDWQTNQTRLLQGARMPIRKLAFAPSSNLLVGGYPDGQVVLWDTTSVLPVRKWLSGNNPVHDLVVEPQCRWVASLNVLGQVKVWDPFNQKTVFEIDNNKEVAASMTLSSSGKKLALAYPSGKIELWNTESWKKEKTFKNEQAGPEALCFDPSGEWLAIADKQGSVTVWNLNAYKMVHQLPVRSHALAFHPNGSSLSTATRWGEVSVWNLQADDLGTGGLELSLEGAEGVEILPLYSDRWNMNFSLSNTGQQTARKILVSTRIPQMNIDTIFLVEKMAPGSRRSFNLNFPITSDQPQMAVKLDIRARSVDNQIASYQQNLVLDNIQQANAQQGKYYALIIGIDDYGGEWSPLKNAVTDAQAIAQELRSNYQFDEFIELYDTSASRHNIIRQFEWLGANLRPEDNLFIYYSGHGEYRANLGSGYWVPADAMSRSTSAFISNADIQAYIKGIQAKHTLLIADACYMGELFRGQSQAGPENANLNEYFEALKEKKSRQAITSGGIEPVKDGGGGKHSVFAFYLLQSLTQNESPYLLAGQLFQTLQLPVANNSNQTPQFHSLTNTGDEGGHFLFIRKTQQP